MMWWGGAILSTEMFYTDIRDFVFKSIKHERRFIMVEFNPSNEFKIKANSFLEKHDTSRILKKIKIDPTKIGNALRTYGDKSGTSLIGEMHLSEMDKRAFFTND